MLWGKCHDLRTLISRLLLLRFFYILKPPILISCSHIRTLSKSTKNFPYLIKRTTQPLLEQIIQRTMKPAIFFTFISILAPSMFAAAYDCNPIYKRCSCSKSTDHPFQTLSYHLSPLWSCADFLVEPGYSPVRREVKAPDPNGGYPYTVFHYSCQTASAVPP